ncbi:hypothetical protein, partial [Enterobacter kobei]|uniref:hypothetical protein n=1 Tax=Enterobacter kobei TaxID=208224 RepID=UPI001C9D2333
MLEFTVNHCFQWNTVRTHNRLVAGSSPAGATKYIKDLDEKLSKSFFFASNLGQVMGQVMG